MFMLIGLMICFWVLFEDWRILVFISVLFCGVFFGWLMLSDVLVCYFCLFRFVVVVDFLFIVWLGFWFGEFKEF